MIRISVIIPTHNRAHLLSRCLDSLTRQSVAPDQVIVVDNNSTDNTRAIVSNFSDKLPITYVFESELGRSQARNTGIKKAKHAILAFIDDDCIADRHWIRNTKATLKLGGDEKVVIQGASKNTNPRSLISEVMYYCSEAGVSICLAESKIAKATWRGMPIFVDFVDTKNLIIHKSLLQDWSTVFDPAFSLYICFEDTDLGLRLSRKGIKIVYAKNIVVFHHYVDTFDSFLKNSFRYGRTLTFARKFFDKKFGDTVKIRKRAEDLFGRASVDSIYSLRQQAIKKEEHYRRATLLSKKSRMYTLQFYLLVFLRSCIKSAGIFFENVSPAKKSNVHQIIPLKGTGASMAPLIRDGYAVEVAIKAEYAINSIIVFKKQTTYVAHRVMWLHKQGQIIAKGDNNPYFDEPISRDSILGVVTSITFPFGVVRLNNHILQFINFFLYFVSWSAILKRQLVKN